MKVSLFAWSIERVGWTMSLIPKYFQGVMSQYTDGLHKLNILESGNFYGKPIIMK